MQNAEYRPDTAFFHGSSMGDVFRDGDRLIVEPCEVAGIRKGDVVVFTTPGDGQRIVHRVIAVGADRFRTRGDANPRPDSWLLGRESLIGRVTVYERNGGLHPVAGGRRGQLRALVTRTIRRVDHISSTILHPMYHGLSRCRFLRRLIPDSLSPRVITIRRGTGIELQLLMGKKLIGRRCEGDAGWAIRRPYRLLVDESTLPTI